MERKWEYLLDSSNTLNMFEIEKCWNKIFQKDWYFHSKLHCLTLDLPTLQNWERYFCFCLQISLLFRFVGF